MTKEVYLEMCATMGTEPIEEEIPVEHEDLLADVQEALNIYSKLRDEWDTMNGVYLGKNFTSLLDIFTIYGVAIEDRKTVLDLINIIDVHRSKVLNKKKAKAKVGP